MKKLLCLIVAFSLFACEKLENAVESEVGQTESKIGKADSTKLGNMAQDYYSYDFYRSPNFNWDYLSIWYFSSLSWTISHRAINPDQQLVWHFRPKFYSVYVENVQIRATVVA